MLETVTLGTTTPTSKRCDSIEVLLTSIVNSDGSYYYQNTDSSKYYNSGTGYSQYTDPSGGVHKSTSK